MMTFPTTPTIDQIITHGTDTWSWDGQKWTKHDRQVTNVEFYAKSPLSVEVTDERVTYKFDSGNIKNNAKLFEIEVGINFTSSGEPFYTFHPSHQEPNDVLLYLTRGMRYVFKQTLEDYNQYPLKFYENKAGTVLFGRRPEEFIYDDGVITDENILTFHPKYESPDTLLYGAENGTQLGVLYLIDKYN